MFDVPQAPADITPKTFFGEWLPSQLDNFKDLIQTFSGDLSASMSVKVDGDNGGEWTVGLGGGAVNISDGLSSDSVVTIVVSEKNFVEAVTGQLDEYRMQPPGGMSQGDLDPEAIKKQAADNLEVVKGISGALQFCLDDPDNPVAVTICFGGEVKDPDCVIKVDKEDAKSMASGETNPQAAFMSGKIRIEGDMSLLMQLTPLMMQ
jgi:putative sterol carrier protein